MEISNRPDKIFEVMVIKIFTKLEKNGYFNKTFSKEIQNIQKS